MTTAGLTSRERAVLDARVARVRDDLVVAVAAVYGDDAAGPIVADLLELARASAAARSVRLRTLDDVRQVDPTWFLRADQLGYVAYVDRFAETLTGVRARLDYLAELGVTYLHLMPLLASRPGENDGGYAVTDYDAVDPALGTMDDLVALADDLHGRGMALCVDLVVNHTAAEHPWARAAVEGDEAMRARYLIFPDRTMPDRFEPTLREVFPHRAPGNFTSVDDLGWVWTTFHPYQWDLNWANPEVLLAMADVILTLANRGVDVFRLDAVPFLWKELGTSCENRPQAHRLLEILRAVAAVAAPAVVFKAEAIVPPDDLVPYLGAHRLERHECDLAYHNQLMVQLWSSLAARDVRVMAHQLAVMREPPPTAGYVTYVRCHDDIGWAITDDAAASVGWNAFAHRDFLNAFYAGETDGSWARGARFGINPTTQDARISGTAAALCGVDAARDAGDAVQLDAAIRRLVLLHAVTFCWGGLPVLYMGDELALANDETWADDAAHAHDNRWMHRPRMPWAAAEARHDPATVEGRVFAWMRRLAQARRSLPVLDARGRSLPVNTGNDHVFAWIRRHPRHPPLLGVGVFADDYQITLHRSLDLLGVPEPRVVLASDTPHLVDGRIGLPAWGWALLAG